jgi:hypothetical protein
VHPRPAEVDEEMHTCVYQRYARTHTRAYTKHT